MKKILIKEEIMLICYLMKLFKIFALISLPLCLNSEIDEENEFKIELLFFKYREVATSEIFSDSVKIPDINFENIIVIEKRPQYSNFSSIENFFLELFNNNPKNIKTLKPNTWFRNSDNFEELELLKSKLSKDNKIAFFDSKSWIQTIPEETKGEYLLIEDKLKEYSIYLKFYKKRFLHMHLISFLKKGNNFKSDLNLFIDEDRRIFNENTYFIDHPYFGMVVSIKKL